MPLHYDSHGNLKPIGQAERVIAEDDRRYGSLSSAFIVNGNASVQRSSFKDELVLTTGATSGSVASITTSPLDHGPHPALVYEIDGLKLNTHELAFIAGFEGLNNTRHARTCHDWQNNEQSERCQVQLTNVTQTRFNLTRPNDAARPKTLTIISLMPERALGVAQRSNTGYALNESWAAGACRVLTDSLHDYSILTSVSSN